MDHTAFAPEVICLKEPGELGNELAAELPVYANLLLSKWDVTILPRLAYLVPPWPDRRCHYSGSGGQNVLGTFGCEIGRCACRVQRAALDRLARWGRQAQSLVDSTDRCALSLSRVHTRSIWCMPRVSRLSAYSRSPTESIPIAFAPIMLSGRGCVRS